MALQKINLLESERVRQGDIFENVPYYESYLEENGEFNLQIISFPYVLVLTQDCDLEQNKKARKDYKTHLADEVFDNDKHLISIIVVPLYNEEHLFTGDHLSEIKIKSQKITSTIKSNIKSNQNARYHYMIFDESITIPNSIIDFKHYFTVSLDWLEKNIDKRKCGIDSVFRELISQRFSNYLSRIGLPEPDNTA